MLRHRFFCARAARFQKARRPCVGDGAWLIRPQHVRGTADRGDVAAYVLPRVRVLYTSVACCRLITPLRRPCKWG